MIMTKISVLTMLIYITSFMTLVAQNIQNIGLQEMQYIDADNSAFGYTGRVDVSDPKAVVFDFPGVAIKTRFTGTSCYIRLVDSTNYYQVEIDAQSYFITPTTDSIRPLARNLINEEHTLLIFKRTEASVGKAIFKGILIDKNAKVLPPKEKPERRIEFIGNSITCGYGNEGDNPQCDFSADTENAYMSYASMIARHFAADHSIIAYSGKGLVRNYNDSNKTSEVAMPQLFERTCVYNKEMKWEFSRFIPQLVIINLGTNDFSTKPHPEEAVFKQAYNELINKLRSTYNNPVILCISGPFIDEPAHTYIKQFVDSYRIEQAYADIHFVAIPRVLLKYPTDYGCDGHPNVKANRKMANLLILMIATAMGWE